ncbi:MAG TPA: CheR family methyltransferase [Steroidobacteraceae bacterium]|nr:CheR family methyltransferase [Steroidobacteraceae bacterium]
MLADALSGPRWNQVSELIAARTGLHFPPERRADLKRALGEAAPEFGCRDGDDCANWLLASPPSREELRKLARHLTIGETYFFRERPSFNALASHVLPLLIHRKRAGDRRLRLWSAACSTGEEAYSLAMLVQQVLPDWRDWNIRILGTDLNPHSLRKAEAGIYGEWSFRDCPGDLRERFFSPVGDRRHRVRAELRAMVTFGELNLAQDAFPSLNNDTHAMDLILCRNLLIYFTPNHARRLIGNLRQALVDDGWLIVSPSECSQALFGGFTAVNFPGSVLYRKREPNDVARTAEPAFLSADALPLPLSASLSDLQASEMLSLPLHPAGPPAARVDFVAELAAAEDAFARGEYADAADRLRPVLSVPADGDVKLRALGMLTRALANQGVLDEALRVSVRWIAADKLDAAAHYLHAMVLQELGDRAQSRAALQCAVYLQPEFTLAHFALGNHARAEARVAEARRHFANAARLLAGLPADSTLPESAGLTAGRLREIIVSLGMDT